MPVQVSNVQPSRPSEFRAVPLLFTDAADRFALRMVFMRGGFVAIKWNGRLQAEEIWVGVEQMSWHQTFASHLAIRQLQYCTYLPIYTSVTCLDIDYDT